MKKLILLFLLALPALAEEPARFAYPLDYTPSPCAPDVEAVCKTFTKESLSSYGGTFRGFNLKQDWINQHWDEMTKLFLPMCARMASCFTIKGNDWVFCQDIMRSSFLDVCNRYPAGSEDFLQCTAFSTTYFVGLGSKTKLHQQAQECATAQPSTGTRKLVAWLEPATFPQNFDGDVFGFAYDAETHIPVRANIAIDGGKLTSTDGPIPSTGYVMKYRSGLAITPNTPGHREVHAPTATFSAEGYESATAPIAMDVSTLRVEMTPSPAQLKPGMNTITVSTIDALTGKPAEMRVMAGDRVLGKANTPIQFEWPKGEKRPEIWVTSLFNHYSDVVVAPAQ